MCYITVPPSHSDTLLSWLCCPLGTVHTAKKSNEPTDQYSKTIFQDYIQTCDSQTHIGNTYSTFYKNLDEAGAKCN